MPYKVLNISYDLQQKRVSVAVSADTGDQGYVSASFNLHVPPETPERDLKHQMEEQARRVLQQAAEFAVDPSKVPIA